MTQRFQGKIAAVIGGNSGIGLASAMAFADEGAEVIIVGRNADTLHRASQDIGRNAAAYRCDTSDLVQIEILFRAIRARFNRVDVLFVAAGVAASLPIESVTERDWDRVQDVNVKGAFFSVKCALPLMSFGSSVVLTGSVAAAKGESCGALYAASKASVRALGNSLAAEFLERGIRVNVVTPGPIDTPLLDRIEGIPTGRVAAVRRGMTEAVPMRRLGTPEEVAAAVLFLASDSAAFITGSELVVDGGITHLWSGH